MKKSILVIALLLVGALLQRAFAQNYIAQPFYQDGKIRFYAQASPINPASVAHSLDLTAGMQAAWGVIPDASNGPNASIIHNNKLFVSFDLGLQKGGVLVYNMLDITAPPTVINPGGGPGKPCAGMAIQPSTGDLYIATFSGGATAADGGIYYSTAGSTYTNTALFAGYSNSQAIDYYTANVAFDSANNLWATTWSGNTDATQMFLVCFKNTNASSFYKIINTVAKSYTATSTGGVSKTVHLLSAPEGLARDASGNLWVGNNNDFNTVNNAGEGTLIKISNAWITTLLAQAAGSTVTVPAASVNAYYIPSGKLGGMALSGNTLYVNDQGQSQGNSYLTSGTVWRYDVTTAFNATNFKASGIRATYPGNGQMSFSTALPITIPPPAPPTKLFVKANAAGLNNGTSWANAYTDLQSALYNTSLDSVFVAAGTYKPTNYPTSCSSCTSTREYAFIPHTNSKIFGGFAGTEKWLSQRPAIGIQPSILSGDIGIVGTNTDNTYHVVLVMQTQNVLIDGFTIEKGYTNACTNMNVANGETINNSVGAGLLATNADGLTIQKCTIQNNIINTTCNGIGTSNGYYLRSGAGIYLKNLGNTTINDCNILNNTAESIGGGVYVEAWDFYCKVTNSTFKGNSAGVTGGGLMSRSNMTFNNNIFDANTAPEGAGMALWGGTNTITNHVFANNLIPSTNAWFLEGKGAGLYLKGFDAYTLSNSTFFSNQAQYPTSYGGGLYENAIAGITTSSSIKNCIFSGNLANSSTSSTAHDIYSINTTAYKTQISNTLISVSNNFLDMTDAGNNKLNLNPEFTDISNVAGADNKYRTADDGLHPACIISPALNASNTAAPATDITGAARQGIADLGAYESTCTNTTVFQSNSTTCQTITQTNVPLYQWTHFANASGMVCSINPVSQNLGTVTAKVADPTGIVVNGVTRYMGRSVNLTSTIPPNTNYLLRIYFKDTEITEFQSATGQTGLTPGSFKIMWASGGTNASCGVNNFYGTTGGVIGNTGVTTGEFGSNNEGFYLQIGLDHFTLFAATTDTQNTIVGTENEEIASANANIYPNPTTNDLNIELTGNTDVKMDAQIFDITGRAMTAKQTIQDGKANIKMQDMPNGIYNLVITNGTQVVLSKRVVKL
jgi:Secretion system C-terminal sorting domain